MPETGADTTAEEVVAPAPTPSARDRLMDVALEHLQVDGVLGGLNLREIASRAGVTPANIYHYFGSRRGLLRAALIRASARLSDPIEALVELPFTERRLAVFDRLTQTPELKLGALLALDHDPDFEPLPFGEDTVEQYQAQVEAGELPPDLDVIATHLVTLAASIGMAIYGDAVARQLDVERAELMARARAVLEAMVSSITETESGGGNGVA